MIVAHLMEWLHLLLRWLHVVAAIAWVGASFYFIWVENALSRGEQQRTPKIAGHLWSVHGGGFYYLEKYKYAPEEIPEKLHWFKWEAYVTWLSGVALLVLVYYVNASAWLAVADGAVSPNGAIAVSVGLIVGGWLGYDILCRTSLLQHSLWLAVLWLVIGVMLVYFLSGVLTPRAIFLHLGAMIGTAMAGNVFFVIIPAQKKLVAAAMENHPPDLDIARRAALRSLHNNYLTLPAVFLMLSAHYPSIYQHSHAGSLFVLLSLMGGFIRHFFNRKNNGNLEWKWLVPAAVTLVSAVVLSLPPKLEGSKIITTADIRPLIATHCAGCHSANPSDAVFRTAPLGLVLDSEQEILAAAQAIYQRTVIDRSMPFNNQTNMTDDEREAIAAWYRTLKLSSAEASN